MSIRMFGSRCPASKRNRARSPLLESMEGRQLLSGLVHLTSTSARPISALTDTRSAAEATPSLGREATTTSHVELQGEVSSVRMHKAPSPQTTVHHPAPASASHSPRIVAAVSPGPAPLSQAWINYLILLGKEDPTLAYHNILTDVSEDKITAGDGEEILWGINPNWFKASPLPTGPTVDVPHEGGPGPGNGMGYPAGGDQSVAGFLPFPDDTVTGTPLAGTPFFSAFTVTGHNAANTANGVFTYSTQRYGSGYNFIVIIHSGAYNYGDSGTGFQPYYENDTPLLVGLYNPIYTF